MSMDSPSWSQGAEPPPAKKSGSKVWLILGVSLGLCVVLCCGGFIAMSLIVGNQFKDAASFDAASINQTRTQMVSIDIPETIPPRFKIDIPVPFTGQKMFVITYYGEPQGENMIWLAEAGQFLEQQTQNNPDQIRSQLDAQLTAQAANAQTGSFKTITATSQRDVEISANGQTSTITLVEGESGGKKYIQAHGDFRGKNGRGFLKMQLEADKYTMDQAEDILKSIK